VRYAVYFAPDESNAALDRFCAARLTSRLTARFPLGRRAP
jgi:hypothetical protein